MSFFVIVIGVWTAMHAYVVSRLWSLPALASPLWHRVLLVAAVLLWLSFPLGQVLARVAGRVAAPLEVAGSAWVGILFLLLVCLLGADLLTGFGWFLPSWSGPARQWAIGVALLLSLVALVQGLRAPVVREYTVPVASLRPELEGLRIVQLSDMHVGPLLRTEWIEARRQQVDALRPDIVFVTGDLVDQDARLALPLVPALARIRARLGVWGVIGNHEYYAGLEQALVVFERSGFRLLRDASVEVTPGLVVAGVDDLTARRQFGTMDHPVERTLESRPQGATIFLSHSPWEVEKASSLGVNLMLSGHTHGGQIWPFSQFVRMVYPHVAGRYQVNGMTLVVSRGTGFWGPPMRLFKPAEINLITLTRPEA